MFFDINEYPRLILSRAGTHLIPAQRASYPGTSPMRINIAGLCIQIEKRLPLSLEDLPCHFKFRDGPGWSRLPRS